MQTHREHYNRAWCARREEFFITAIIKFYFVFLPNWVRCTVLPWTCSESCDRLCFTSCQDRQIDHVEDDDDDDKTEAGASDTSLLFILVIIFCWGSIWKQRGVMRNFNFALWFVLFLICSCALLSKITRYLFLHGLNCHGYHCLWNAKCEIIDILFCHFDSFFSLAWGQKWCLTTCSYVWIYKCVCKKIWLWIFIIVFTFCYIVFHLQDK